MGMTSTAGAPTVVLCAVNIDSDLHTLVRTPAIVERALNERQDLDARRAVKRSTCPTCGSLGQPVKTGGKNRLDYNTGASRVQGPRRPHGGRTTPPSTLQPREELGKSRELFKRECLRPAFAVDAGQRQDGRGRGFEGLQRVGEGLATL